VKKATVIWSEHALNDLDVIFDFLSEKSLKAAEKIISAILSRTAQLESFPESGQKQEKINSSKIYRYLIEEDYKIIYSYINGVIYIHTVFDCRQDPDKMKG
jgi:plasmid stabilization system protein ParE